jgi:DNA replication protein DnaC
MAKQSKCKCGRVSDSLFGHCHVCFNKEAFSVLPAEQQKIALDAIVHERFVDADLSHLPIKLVEKIKALPDAKGLMLWGPQGRGKTYAMAAIAKMYFTQGFTVARENYEMLCLQLRDTFRSKGDKTEYAIIKPLLEADKLFIEDIGTTKSEGSIESDFSLRTLLVLIDYRLERCRPTFITTNRTIEELSKTFDERITSRIQQGCEIIRFEGEDKRQCTK